MIKTFKFYFNHEDVKPEFRNDNIYCHVWYVVEGNKPKISSIQISPSVLLILIPGKFRNIIKSLYEAMENNFNNLVKPSMSTGELAEHHANGQYE